MGEHYTAPEFVGISCDATGCAAEHRTEPVGYFSQERARFWQDAKRDGWSLWVGRSRRTYCPDHGPRPGHRMRREYH